MPAWNILIKEKNPLGNQTKNSAVFKKRIKTRWCDHKPLSVLFVGFF